MIALEGTAEVVVYQIKKLAFNNDRRGPRSVSSRRRSWRDGFPTIKDTSHDGRGRTEGREEGGFFLHRGNVHIHVSLGVIRAATTRRSSFCSVYHARNKTRSRTRYLVLAKHVIFRQKKIFKKIVYVLILVLKSTSKSLI